jgi:subtilisin family serine protease
MHDRRAARPNRAVVALLALAMTTGLVMAASPATAGGKIDAKVLRAVKGGKVATYWAILRRSADLSGASSIKDWDARGAWVVDRLQAVANSSQRELKALLKRQGVSFRPFWIINALRITSKAATLQAVAARREVASIVPTWSAKVPKPIMSPDVGVDAIEWNILRINADDVWNMFNNRGEGITVANIDTGVQWDHPALIRNYRGRSVFDSPVVNHNYNWFDPSGICPLPAPCDNNSHGTHTMGTMVGDDRGANQIGVAPRAYWIAAKGCESNFCSDFALLESGQWMLAPRDLNDQNPRPDLRPHVVNNSWGDPNGSNQFYRSTVQAWVASGIFPAFSNGNSGPGCGTVGAPGSYPESYGTGAFDINNNIAGFSSRGPSPIDGGIKPNISAPGVSVRSSVSIPPNGYASFSGTSMAAPHVAGTVALMWALNGKPQHSRNIAVTKMALDASAIDVSNLTCGGTPENNNVWGQGRLDALGAVNALP